MRTPFEDSLDFIPGFASLADGCFAHGSESISQQVTFLVEPLATQRQPSPIRYEHLHHHSLQLLEF